MKEMARGWESKSVEEQMTGREAAAPAKETRMYESEVARRTAEQERTTRARRRQALELQRQNILGQRTSNAGRRAALEAALKAIEAEMEKDRE